MIFPITDLLDERESVEWVEAYFHPHGLRCSECDATTEQARRFRARKRGLVDHRCQHCQHAYNLYTGSIFAGSKPDPRRVVLLLRGVCKGGPSTVLSQELGLSRRCVHRWRKRIQEKAHAILSQDALRDCQAEADEMFENAGGERRQARRPAGSATSPRQQPARTRDL